MNPLLPEYRISTITATASLNTEINLDVLYQSLNTMCEEEVSGENEGIVYIEYGRRKIETIYKGTAKKYNVKHRTKEQSTKRFDNQVTLVYKFINKGVINMLNSKIFKNGNVQMTGIRNIEQGKEMINVIVNLIKTIYSNGYKDVVSDIDNIGCINYQVRLINTDFKVGFDIRRDQLHRILVEDYGCNCSFEPCIYPGVKLQYYYNKENTCEDGNCKCQQKCLIGKGCGCGEGNCKKITIAIFQSGCIIITGGQNLNQVNEAHRFICKVLNDNYDIVHKKKIVVPSSMNGNCKKILLKISNIKYLDNEQSYMA